MTDKQRDALLLALAYAVLEILKCNIKMGEWSWQYERLNKLTDKLDKEPIDIDDI